MVSSQFSAGQITEILRKVSVRVKQATPSFDYDSLASACGVDDDGNELLCLVPRMLLAPQQIMGLRALVPGPQPGPQRHTLIIAVFAVRMDGMVVKDRYGWFRVGNSVFGCNHPQIREIPLFTSVVRECAVCGKEIK